MERMWRFSLYAWVAATLLFMAAMSISSALFFLITAIFLFRELDAEWRTRILRSGYFWAALGMLGAALLSMAVAWIDPPLGLRATSFGEIKKFLYFFLPILAAWGFLRLGRENGKCLAELNLWPVLWWTSGLVSLVAIFQYWAVPIFGPGIAESMGKLIRQIPNSPHGHGQGFMGFHLSFASALCFSFCYAFARAIWIPSGAAAVRWRERLLWLALSLLIAVAVFYTYSRIAWLALILAAVLLMTLYRPIWALSSMAAAGALGALVWFTSSDVRYRFNDPLGWDDRGLLFRNAWVMFTDRPWTGVGFAKSGFYADHYAEKLFGINKVIGSHAHNNLLDVLATTGIFGALAYFAWWACLLTYAWESFRRSRASDAWLPAALFVGGIIFQVNGLTQVNFYDAKSQHAMVLWAALVLALHWQDNWRKDEQTS